MAILRRKHQHLARPLRSILVWGLALSAALVLPPAVSQEGTAAAQIPGLRDVVAVSLSPEVRERMGEGTISVRDAVHTGLVVSSDHEQPTEVVLVVGHLRDGKIVESGVSRPFRLRSNPAQAGDRIIGETEKNVVRDAAGERPGWAPSAYPRHDADRPVRQALRVDDWPSGLLVPQGRLRGDASRGGSPALDAVERIDQPVSVSHQDLALDTGTGGVTSGSTDLRGSRHPDGYYLTDQSLDRSGVNGKLDWDRYEALYLMAIPTDLEKLQRSQIQALIIPFVPDH
jgi:hypothetical protein